MPEEQPAEQKKPRATVAGLQKQIDEMEEALSEILLDTLTPLNKRISALEEALQHLIPEEITDHGAKLKALEACWKQTNAIAEGTRVVFETHTQQIDSLLEVVSELQNEIIDIEKPTEHIIPEPVFDTQPIPAGVVAELTYDTIANLSSSLVDVLMLCKILAVDTSITDKERVSVLELACKRTGLQMTAGMQYRAGVKNVSA